MSGIFKSKKRFTAFLLAVTVLFAFMSAVFFIGIEADHDCSGDDCLICFQISNCANVLKSCGAASFCIAAVFCLLTYIIALCFHRQSSFKSNTLVSLNIKISD